MDRVPGHEYTTTYANDNATLQQGTVSNTTLNYCASFSPEKKEKIDRGIISLSDPRNDFETIKISKPRTSGTCTWVTHTKPFNNWKTKENVPLLAITGSPGIGKTVISTFLVDSLDQVPIDSHARHDPKIIYFFCNAESKDRSSAIAVLRGLLFQLCLDSKILEEHMQKEYDAYKPPKEGILENFEALWRVLNGALRDPQTGRVIVVVDAIDECSPECQEKLLCHLKQLFTQPTSHPSQCKIILTCRSDSTLFKILEEPHEHLRVNRDRIADDLGCFIKSQINRLHQVKQYPRKLRRQIEKRLQENNGGTFLWAYMVLAQLEKIEKNENEKVRSCLRRCPNELSELYDQILERIPANFQADVIFLFHLLAVVRRPLTKAEVLQACCLNFTKSWSLEGLDEDHSRFAYIINLCPELVYIEGRGKFAVLHFVHHSVKEYLLEYPKTVHSSRWPIWPNLSLLMPFFSDFLYSVVATVAASASSSFFSIVPWILHQTLWTIMFAVAADQRSTLSLEFHLVRRPYRWLHKFYVRKKSHLRLRGWVREYYHVDSNEANFLLFTICFKSLMQQNFPLGSTRPSSKRSFGGYAAQELHSHAALSGQEVIERFSWRGKMIMRHPKIQCLWIKRAAESSTKSTLLIIDLLLDSGVNIDTEIPTGGLLSSLSPLSTAAAKGNHEVVELLLHRGAKLEIRDDQGWTPLRWATYGAHIDTIRKLIEGGADVDAIDNNGETHLMWMIGQSIDVMEWGRITISEKAKSFIGVINVAKDDSVDISQWSRSASNTQSRTSQDIVQLLAERSRNIDLRDGKGMTALCRAAKNNQFAFVCILLKLKADPNTVDQQGMTPLLWALRSPRTTLKFQDICIMDEAQAILGQMVFRRYQLQDAAPSGEEVYQEAMNLLICQSDDINAQDFTGRSPLSLAAENAHCWTTRRLMEENRNGKRVDPNSRDKSGMTPLMWASRIPVFCTSIFETISVAGYAGLILGNILILDDPSNKSPRFDVRNPYGPANYKVLEELVDFGASLVAIDNQGRNALCFALEDELDGVCDFLKKMGATLPPGFSSEHFRERERGIVEIRDAVVGENGRLLIGSISTKERNEAMAKHGMRHFAPKSSFEQCVITNYARAILPGTTEPHPETNGIKSLPRCNFHSIVVSGGTLLCRIEPEILVPETALRYEYFTTFPKCEFQNIAVTERSTVQCGNFLVIPRENSSEDIKICSQMVGNNFRNIVVSEEAVFTCDLFKVGDTQIGFENEMFGKMYSLLRVIWNDFKVRDQD